VAKRILITGASGFIGANLARRLITEGHDVHLIVRPGHTLWRLDRIESPVHTAELGDAEAVRAAVRKIRPEWIFHLAVYGAYSHQENLEEMVHTNIAGTANVVEACLQSGFESFVNTGSSSEYGFQDHAPVESDLVRPNSVYAVTKAAATLYCGYAARRHGARIRTLRLYSVFGPWEEPSRLIPTLIVCGLNKRLPSLVENSVARDFVYVDDVCDAYLAVAANPSADNDAVMNVGTGRQTRLAEVVDVTRRLLRIDAEPHWGSMPNRPWDTTTWVSDNRRIQRETGWTPRHSLEAGLLSTIRWFQDNPAWLKFYEERRTNNS
jgi:nucleoside-diphosphate-sugar epimerase